MFSDKEQKIIKILDFGVSTTMDETRQTSGAAGGTFRYMPLEQLDCILSPKTDIWALGCIMLQFITGNIPYHTLDNEL
jgi:serine/threonine protein kinase